MYALPAALTVLDDLNVRRQPQVADGNIAGMYQKGDTASACGEHTDEAGQLWYVVYYDGTFCYVSGEFAELIQERPIFMDEIPQEEETPEPEAGDADVGSPQEDMTGPMPQRAVEKTEDIPSLDEEGHGHIFTTLSDGTILVESY